MPYKPPEVEVLPWVDFLARIAEEFTPGMHGGLVAPTGEAKTTVAHGVLMTRSWSAVLDVKGGDDTIAAFGWPRVTRLPLAPELLQKIEKGEPARIIVGGTGRSKIERANRRALHLDFLEWVLEVGHWTVFCDDLKTLCDPRYGRAGDLLVEMYLLARGAGISVWSAWQNPTGVPREAGDQATLLGFSYTRDRDRVERLAEMMGRSRSELQGAVTALGELPYGWLFVNRSPRAPYYLTRPEKLKGT